MNPLVVQGAAQLLLGKYKSEKGLFMKNILTMGATGLVIFAGLGWYLDWYKVARTTTPDGKQHITIDLNTQRIKSDYEKGREEVSGYLGGLTNPNAPTPPVPYGSQPVQPPTPYPSAYPPNYAPAPAYPPAYNPPSNWAPTAPTSRPTGTYPGYAPPAPTSNPYPPSAYPPGRPF